MFNPPIVYSKNSIFRYCDLFTSMYKYFNICIFSAGYIKGDILIDISPGSLVHHLFGACAFFQHIIVLKIRDSCIIELKRWVDSRTRAFDWSHITKHHAGIEGNSDQLQDKEGKVRSALQHIVKCNLKKEDMMDPIILPPADCIISAWLLDMICKNQNDLPCVWGRSNYIRYLRKFLKLLKPGGHFIIIGALNLTFYTVGKHKFHAFNYDEDFARKDLVGEGFIIDRCKVKKRTDVNNHNDYKGMIFIEAYKEI
ncbi:nicotinamide N-methyltransferase-like [Ranitomeya variabilis]|uniref:nicotinamide N-methyltransferase-like n=1 Tax=Ranitomeya variabilis TaxID=490064 RepID=UPI004056315A